MGVCIETDKMKRTSTKAGSHPIWVCVLKLGIVVYHTHGFQVTPYMGVCIETFSSWLNSQQMESHPIWVCVLKQEMARGRSGRLQSHPIWVCVLKLLDVHVVGRGLVVTPYMGVCIETTPCLPAMPCFGKSHPIWVCVLKLQPSTMHKIH